MASYYNASIEVFNAKTKSGEWTIESAPARWTAFNAVAMVKDKNGKEYKVIIVNYFLNNKTETE